MEHVIAGHAVAFNCKDEAEARLVLQVLTAVTEVLGPAAVRKPPTLDRWRDFDTPEERFAVSMRFHQLAF